MSESPLPEPKLTKPQPAKRRRWRWVIWSGLAVFMLLVCLVVLQIVIRTWTRQQSERDFVEAISSVEQTDPDWTWERLNAKRARPPEGKNGAELIPQIKKLSHPDWGKELSQDEWKPQLEVAPNHRFSPLVITEVRHEMDASAKAIVMTRSLKDYAFGHREIHLVPDVVSTRLEDTQNTRHAADLLHWDVVLAAEDNDQQRVAKDLLALLNTSRSIGDEPFLISQLVRIAVRTVMVRQLEWALTQLSKVPELAEIQTALAVDAEEPLLLNGVRGDRAAFDRLFENMDSGSVTPANAFQLGTSDPWSRWGWWQYRALLPADRGYALQWMTKCVECARLPLHKQPNCFAAIPIPRDSRYTLSRLLLPAVNKVAAAHWRSVGEARCAVVGIACERFRQKNGRWPKDLNEFLPDFLSAIPLDPYTGKPLHLTQSKEGIIIYSVG